MDYSLSISQNAQTVVDHVLILILMDYSLRFIGVAVFFAVDVLILILMDYSLRLWQRACYTFLTFTILQKSLLFLRELVQLE